MPSARWDHVELALRKEVTEGCSSDSSYSRKAERKVQQVSVGARTRTRTFSIFWGLFSFIIMSKTLITAVRSGGRVNGKGKISDTRRSLGAGFRGDGYERGVDGLSFPWTSEWGSSGAG